MTPIASAAAKVGLCFLVIGAVVLRTRNMPRDQLGFTRPPIGLSMLFVAVYLGWMLASDLAFAWRGPWDFAPWRQAPLAASAMRVLAVGILGPVAEELIFRAFIYSRLIRFGPAAAIAVTGIGWAILHFDYTPVVIGIIVVDGILLGLARWRTGSVVPPILMHVLYNLYAVW
jgi:membrane protease YdiL (CAAX protease family)